MICGSDACLRKGYGTVHHGAMHLVYSLIGQLPKPHTVADPPDQCDKDESDQHDGEQDDDGFTGCTVELGMWRQDSDENGGAERGKHFCVLRPWHSSIYARGIDCRAAVGKAGNPQVEARMSLPAASKMSGCRSVATRPRNRSAARRKDIDKTRVPPRGTHPPPAANQKAATPAVTAKT